MARELWIYVHSRVCEVINRNFKQFLVARHQINNWRVLFKQGDVTVHFARLVSWVLYNLRNKHCMFMLLSALPPFCICSLTMEPAVCDGHLPLKIKPRNPWLPNWLQTFIRFQPFCTSAAFRTVSGEFSYNWETVDIILVGVRHLLVLEIVLENQVFRLNMWSASLVSHKNYFLILNFTHPAVSEICN